MESFLAGSTSLNKIELDLLGNIAGKSVLHLQCHFGQDSISLARLGAEVTAIDLSDQSIAFAKDLAKKTNTNVDFICCDIYEIEKHLNKKFDIVFTSYGVIGWLPDMDKWAKIISNYLKPNAQFIMAEFHPVVWMYDNDFKTIQYSYFNIEPIIETETGTYANKNANILQKNITWNHSLSEVLNSLIDNGLEIKKFHEFNHSPYNCFNQALETETGKFIISHFGNKIPMVYSIIASKKGS
jgi:2-polyprenyl-3-methyl-5-hydroxy-6-metoxy-1,4-benzoquinol methylase